MEINGYVVTSLAYMASGGPLWNATGPSGEHVLLTLRPSGDGERLEGRWRAWAGIDSVHVVRLLDVARHEDGRWAVVMERVGGDTLEVLLARGDLRGRTRREAVATGIARGLESLHTAGLVHGDVSPANVVVRPDGTAVLVDLVDAPQDVVGTPGWEGTQRGPGGDLESLGRIRRALDTGSRPDGEVTPWAPGGAGPGGARHATAPAPPPGPGEVAGVVLRRVGASPETRRNDAPARHRRARRRNPLALGLACVACAGLVALALVRAHLAVGEAGPPGHGGGTAVSVGGEGPGEAAPRAQQDPTVDPQGQEDLPGSGSAETGGHAAQDAVRAGCPSPGEVGEAFSALVAARDAALESWDGSALDAVSVGAARQADLEVLAALESSGTRVDGLGTEVGPVERVTCTGAEVRFTTTLRQMAHRRCALGRCRELPPGASRTVTVRMVTGPWRVTAVGQGPGQDPVHEGGSDR